MRNADEISAMWDQLDNNIREHGWDPTVDGAVWALAWVLDIPPGNTGTMLQRAMQRGDSERRREWIARGGDPKDWPEERPAGSEENTG